MSSFFAKNFLYGYALNQLDEERKKALEKILAEDESTQKEFIKLTNGLQYTELLSEILVSEEIVKSIVNRNSQLEKWLAKIKFNQWPVTVKWTMEAIFIVTLMIVTLNVIPWSKLVHMTMEDQNDNLIIAQYDYKKKESAESTSEPNKISPEFVDEEVKSGASGIPSNGGNKKSESMIPANNQQVVAKSTVSVANKQDVKSVGKELKATVVSENITKEPLKAHDSVAKVIDEKIKSPNKVSGGFLYRGQLYVTNVEMIAPKINAKITEFGGRKAGEVEIGWKKTNQVFYYHFTIPDAKLKDLQEYLKIYTDVKLQKETHPRIMPDGIIRIIFTVEEKNMSQGQK
ncbi:MAG: hypothetical protein L6Q37_08315 [Bdellovibrionaceae bacterium]|nr:hypothetical protein [Pseudobdellovibrionaceae bacterium]NUM57689.1 hypothetical protein [Pseudobdellovibrionaceae bacterium]